MYRLLLVSHCPSPNTLALRDAASAGVASLDLATIDLIILDPQAADANDVMACDGIVIGTTENFGAMAGLTKDFFERIYYPCLESTQGLPVGLYIRAGEDGTGTELGIKRIFSGLRWRMVTEPLILQGAYSPSFADAVAEQAMTLAAGLDTGIL